ncbi:sulfatase-like hydrolase/transferase [Flavivirga aquimarina]|uniref:Sulfatase-like hydrolase/transferase n=1 Tax=Flavivirga aquimarina TaxID=2027862 RepID=A0ABT8WCP4_9FLAO|nr:sulfatase-like hydrolase/transferase [Flavivirga aquimarina]MDO5970924.1 sulfatase-like hydrolase/transferase [Flavivirga aquimarina]
MKHVSEIKKLGYLFLIPMGLSFSFECIFNEVTISVVYNLLENLLFGILLIAPLYFLSNHIISKIYFIVSYLFFMVCIYFETSYYYLFKTYFSSSSIFVIFDSNMEETKEFLDFYVDIPIIVFTILIISALFVALIKKRNLEATKLLRTKKNKLKVSALVIAILLFLKFSTLIIFNAPYLMVKSGIEYNKESKKFGNYKENKNGNFKNIYRPLNDDEELYVIIIGESTSRSHLGLYDYYRETTPELKKINKDLLVYKDVISPHAYSVGALTKILTIGNYENPESVSKGSIIQLVNRAGFETYWLSNQRPIGPYESMITKISLSAKNHRFLTTTIAGKSKVLDGELLKEFKKVASNNIKKKVVFVHLMGTHHHYENRYPEAFNKFKDEPITKFKSEENFVKINHYHNAILYNDFIVSELIRQVDDLNTKSFVLYFSDHGEEVFDDLNMAGHNEDIYSKKMFDIPFVLWQSQKYKQENELPFVEDRKYMIDDLFHGMADLLNISANEVDFTRSIFNKDFKERKRVVKDTIDYDTFF